jgi:hypothetical protein
VLSWSFWFNRKIWSHLSEHKAPDKVIKNDQQIFIISHGETISRSCWVPFAVEVRIEPSTFWPVSPTLYQLSYLGTTFTHTHPPHLKNVDGTAVTPWKQTAKHTKQQQPTVFIPQTLDYRCKMYVRKSEQACRWLRTMRYLNSHFAREPKHSERSKWRETPNTTFIIVNSVNCD